MNIVRRAVLEAGVMELGRFEFAGGQKANNKLNFDKLFVSPPQLETVLHHLGRVVLHYEPQALIGIPSGGEKLAELLAERPEVGLPLIYIVKDVNEPGVKTFVARGEEDTELLGSVDSIVLVEDVFNKFTSTLGALAVDGVAERTRAVVGVWDRGMGLSRPDLPVPHEALISEYVPNFLRSGEEIYYSSTN